MHDARRGTETMGPQAVAAAVPRPAVTGQTDATVHWVVVDEDTGLVRTPASSGPDWSGRYGRRPQPRLRGDERRRRLVTFARQLQRRERDRGRHDLVERIDRRLAVLLRRGE